MGKQMNYLGFLCLGLGILTLVAGMLCFLSKVSKESPVKYKTQRIAMVLLPLAIVLISIGLKFSMSVVNPEV
ncbi:hypothetical protein MOOS6835_04170 [Moraxella osloensis]|uniref:Uncharacterized protein n=2 Tax=Faucicola osloensis TaxID=34062 RepID=A0A378Q8W5_FAUOS|nr:Uncharacterised protein [Moraxella osloensis]